MTSTETAKVPMIRRKTVASMSFKDLKLAAAISRQMSKVENNFTLFWQVVKSFNLFFQDTDNSGPTMGVNHRAIAELIRTNQYSQLQTFLDGSRHVNLEDTDEVKTLDTSRILQIIFSFPRTVGLH